MSSISSVTPSVTSTPQNIEGTTSTTTTPTTTTPVLTLQHTLTTQSRAFAMGLGSPRNHGDIEALFAEVAEKFGAEATKATDYAEAAEDAKRSTSLRAAAGNLMLFASLDAAITQAQKEIAEKNREIAGLNAEIDTLNGQIDTLNAQYSEYRAEHLEKSGVIAENITTIAGLGFEWLAAAASGDDAEVARIEAEIDRLESQNSAYADRLVVLDGLMAAIAGQVLELGFQVAGLEIEKGLAELDILFNEAEITAAQGLLDTFAVIFIPFSVDLALRTMGEVGRASFEITPDQSGVDQAIEDAANSIADQAARMGAIDNARATLQQLPSNDPATLTALTDALTRLRQPGQDGGEGAFDVSAALGFLSSIRQMISGGLPPDAVPGQTPVVGAKSGANALDLIRQTLEQTLPPDSGDPQRVVGEAAGLASGLAILRGVLASVGNGESATGTQVPGASGRLNLAI